MPRELRILIVEDEPLISMMLEDFLDCIGCSCAASTGQLDEAIALAERGDYDLAIVDLTLMGGASAEPVLDVLEKIGKPFIVASGDTGYGRPATRLLCKPYNISDLERAIESLDALVSTSHPA